MTGGEEDAGPPVADPLPVFHGRWAPWPGSGLHGRDPARGATGGGHGGTGEEEETREEAVTVAARRPARRWRAGCGTEGKEEAPGVAPPAAVVPSPRIPPSACHGAAPLCHRRCRRTIPPPRPPPLGPTTPAHHDTGEVQGLGAPIQGHRAGPGRHSPAVADATVATRPAFAESSPAAPVPEVAASVLASTAEEKPTTSDAPTSSEADALGPSGTADIDNLC
ncbi:hypothetical protein BS78_07G139400 [Paspalum vaginatum]|nr:hypothetical protein BS78_07G139400 [Paspalum vaginatum]